ncbi:MAG TPA: hypothetical protein VEP90_19670, partial [Methylomirabilota bacterium]|nr:hypothetical protein [Methylomirabilota bacterium]
SVQGKVRIENKNIDSLPEETTEAAEWFKSPSACHSDSRGLAYSCIVDTELDLEMVDATTTGVPLFKIKQFGNTPIGSKCYISGVISYDATLVVSVISVAKRQPNEVAVVSLHIDKPVLPLKYNHFSNKSKHLSDNLSDRTIDLKIVPGPGTNIDEVVKALKKVSVSP